jgi:hypothetical protein
VPDGVAHFPGDAPPFLGHGTRRETPACPPDKTRTVVSGERHWPLAALLLASVLRGDAIIGTKYALRAFDPVALLSLELAAATAALWAVLLIRGYRPPPSWPVAILLGEAISHDGDALSLTTWQFTAATAVALAVDTARWAGHPDRLPIAVAPGTGWLRRPSEWAASR